jgi:hypothetical protein
MLPVVIPVAVGEKLMLKVQLPPEGTDAPMPHVLLCSGNPAATARPEMFSVAAPVFVNVTVCEALMVPSARVPNTRFVLERLTADVDSSTKNEGSNGPRD